MPDVLDRLIGAIQLVGPRARDTQRELWQWADAHREEYLAARDDAALTGRRDPLLDRYERAQKALANCGVIFDTASGRWHSSIDLWA